MNSSESGKKYYANSRWLWVFQGFLFLSNALYFTFGSWPSGDPQDKITIFQIILVPLSLSAVCTLWISAVRTFIWVTPDFLEINGIGLKYRIPWEDIDKFGPVQARGIRNGTGLVLNEPVRLSHPWINRWFNPRFFSGRVVDLSYFIPKSGKSDLTRLILEKVH